MTCRRHIIFCHTKDDVQVFLRRSGVPEDTETDVVLEVARGAPTETDAVLEVARSWEWLGTDDRRDVRSSEWARELANKPPKQPAALGS